MEISRMLFWDYFLFRKKLNLTINNLPNLLRYEFVKVKQDDLPLMIWMLDGVNEDISYIDKVYLLNTPIKRGEFVVKSSIRTKKYVYESKDNGMKELLNYGFMEEDSNIIMKLNLSGNNFICNKADTTFMEFVKGKHDQIRCNIQNEAFYESTRMPLSVKDIMYEYNKRFFINDMSIFINVNNVPIGYGQILLLDNKYTIANLCVLNKYQGQGYGKELLCYLLSLAKKKGLPDVYIKVKASNKRAYNLYRSLGFEDVSKINVFEIH